MEKLLLYKAIFWEKHPDSIGKRVEVFARDIDEAESIIMTGYGDDIIISLYNEEEADKVRHGKFNHSPRH